MNELILVRQAVDGAVVLPVATPLVKTGKSGLPPPTPPTNQRVIPRL